MSDTKGQRCCEQGNFGELHDCAKGQPSESTREGFEKWWAIYSKSVAYHDEHYIDHELIANAGWQARGASEYERGRRDGLEKSAKDSGTAQAWGEHIGFKIGLATAAQHKYSHGRNGCQCSCGAYFNFNRAEIDWPAHIIALAATSGTPAASPVSEGQGAQIQEWLVSMEEFNNSLADEAAQSCVDWADPERRKEALRYIIKQIYERTARTPQPAESTASTFEEWWDENGIDYVPAGELGRPTAKELAQAGWQARGASEYERGPAEMYLCEINHLILHSDQPYIFRKHPDCYGCNKYLAHGTPAEHNPARAPHNKFASLWCDACPRPASGTPAPLYKEEFDAVLGQADYNPSCTKLHYVFHPDSKFQVGEKVRVTIAQAAAPGGKEPLPEDDEAFLVPSHPSQDKAPAAPLCGKRIPETGLGCTLEPGHQGRHDVDVTKVSEAPTPPAAPRFGALKAKRDYPQHWDVATCITADLEEEGLVKIGLEGVRAQEIVRRWLAAQEKP